MSNKLIADYFVELVAKDGFVGLLANDKFVGLAKDKCVRLSEDTFVGLQLGGQDSDYGGGTTKHCQSQGLREAASGEPPRWLNIEKAVRQTHSG